ncbi:MAG: hypothetical protein ABGX12_00965, partial [Desulfurobacteriaceae bacterium]
SFPWLHGAGTYGIRRAVILLSKSTGWGLRELLSLPYSEFLEWLLEAGKVEEEIANAVKAGSDRRDS